jgi:hypothetical protein
MGARISLACATLISVIALGCGGGDGVNPAVTPSPVSASSPVLRDGEEPQTGDDLSTGAESASGSTFTTATTSAWGLTPSFVHPVSGMLMSYTGCSTASPENFKYSVVWKGNYGAGVQCEGSGTHTAVDIPLPANTPLRATADGTVVAVNRYGARYASPWCGAYVILKHVVYPTVIGPVGTTAPKPIVAYSVYCHLTSGSMPASFVNGTRVRRGDYIGGSGNTGSTLGATGQHLHFQIDLDLGGAHPYSSASQTVSPIYFIQNHRYDTVLYE